MAMQDTNMASTKVLVYLLRRDLRVADNPILHHLATAQNHGFTHLLPVYVFPAQQIEISGFLRQGAESPYPEARSQVGRYWRCGPHRAKFVAQSVWNVKESLEALGSGLLLRAGTFGDVVEHVVQELVARKYKVGAVWMVGEEATEEKRDERAISNFCRAHGIGFQRWADEKYFIDDRDLQFADISALPDVFTTYRKSVEPLREKPRATLPRPSPTQLPPLPDAAAVPTQPWPFEMPSSYEELEKRLLAPISDILATVPARSDKAESAHPFKGGETSAVQRLEHLITSGVISTYKDTRNGLIGTDFSTKLSGYLSLGCLTARQIHAQLLAFEDGSDPRFESAPGFGEGENDGTKATRFELLWRDYMRLCSRKFGHRLFRDTGFRDDGNNKWKSADAEYAQPDQQPPPAEIAAILRRFCEGTTGMGLIDASQRELLLTGYTSNRARQNVASFLTKHLGIDWRYGAEWYEQLLVDYDVASNWANWQYVAGVGNDPRGEARIFNPVKQAFDYDKEGKYVRMWLPELANLERLENVFQAWTTPPEDWERLGLTGLSMAEDPVKKIEFLVEGKPKTARRPYLRRRGRGGARGGGNGNENGNGGISPGGNGNGSGSGGSGESPHDGGGSGGNSGGYHGGPNNTPASPRPNGGPDRSSQGGSGYGNRVPWSGPSYRGRGRGGQRGGGGGGRGVGGGSYGRSRGLHVHVGYEYDRGFDMGFDAGYDRGMYQSRSYYPPAGYVTAAGDFRPHWMTMNPGPTM